nr:hypothetical protein Iba_chr11cCG11850 [Ipomoea batatas]
MLLMALISVEKCLNYCYSSVLLFFAVSPLNLSEFSHTAVSQHISDPSLSTIAVGLKEVKIPNLFIEHRQSRRCSPSLHRHTSLLIPHWPHSSVSSPSAFDESMAKLSALGTEFWHKFIANLLAKTTSFAFLSFNLYLDLPNSCFQ